MTKDMKSQTNLVKRGSTYYFRTRIPSDLVEHYRKQEVIFSLRTQNKTEALQRVRIERIKYDQEFHQLRAIRNAAPVELTDTEIDRLAALWITHLLEEDEEFRMEGPSDREFAKHIETINFVEEDFAHCLARGILDQENFELEDFVESHGIKLKRGSQTYRKLAWAFLKASRKSIDLIKARNRGEVVDTPRSEPLVLRSVPRVNNKETLDSLVSYWKTQAERKPRTVLEVETTVSRFIEVNENLITTDIKKSHVVAFKDRMLADGKSPTTVKKYLGLLSAIFETAVANDKLPINPVRGVKVAKQKTVQKARIPFSPDDLNKLFNSPVFQVGLRPLGGKGEAAYWIPLIALWTGARLEEIGQLQVDDIQCEQDIYFIRITDDKSTGQSVKTVSSRRRVPIHSELLRLGLLDYVEKIRNEGHLRLFPLLSSGKGRQLTASWSQWFGRYLRDIVGITDERKVFHSFRHGFKDACRESGISKELHDRLTGHASGDVGDGYGGENFPLSPLADAIKILQYRDFNLKQLQKQK